MNKKYVIWRKKFVFHWQTQDYFKEFVIILILYVYKNVGNLLKTGLVIRKNSKSFQRLIILFLLFSVLIDGVT